MKLAPAERWAAWLALGWAALLVFVSVPRRARATNVRGWRALEGDEVTLRRGARYRGCLVVPWYVPTSLVRAKLRPGLEDKGFSDVAISEVRPSLWPEASCDFFVEATWSRDDEVVERPGAVPLAWEGEE